MQIPTWVQDTLATFETRQEPHHEAEISDALSAARKAQAELSDEDWKGFRAEMSAFLFGGRRGKESVWGTYFGPFMTATREDGTEYRSPDIKELDKEAVAYWEGRANSCANPVMRARYADIVWDLKRAIVGEKPHPDYARLAIDAYLRATDEGFYPMEIVGIQWLGRELDLSLSINDSARIRGVVDYMFTFYDKIAKPHLIGTWVFLFDDLYGNKFVTTELEARIISNLEAMLAVVSDASKTPEGVHPTLDPWGAEAAAVRLAQHYHRLNDRQNVERVTRLYRKSFEHVAREASPMMATAWLQPVIERYQQEGLKDDAEKLQLLYAEKGKNIRSDLKEVSVGVNIKKEDIEHLLEQLSGDLRMSLLRIGAYFVPQVEATRRLLERLETDAPLQSLFPVHVVDADGHTSAVIGSLDEDPDGRLHAQLAQSIGFYQPFLVEALARLRSKYSPSAQEVVNCLLESPLFSAAHEELLKEGLLAYEKEDFVKAVHVLVPQFEHIMRQFLGMLGVPTLKTVRGHSGIMDAKSMNDVLSDARVRKVMTEDLWRYLSVLYIDKRGLNLRNDLAHGLVPPRGFNRQIADQVFHSLLAIGLMRIKSHETKG
jgi:Domain of unknown function (DUF4209)